MKSSSLFLLLSNLVVLTHSLPYLVLSSRSQKCLGIDPPRKTDVNVTYHFPDVVAVSNETADGDTAGSLKEAESQKYKTAMENLMKPGNRANDVSVTLFQRFTDNTATFRRKTGKQDRGTVRSRSVIAESRGSIAFTTAPEDEGVLEICVQSLRASEGTPVRFSLDISMMPFVPEEIKQEKRKRNDQIVDGHVSRIESDIKGCERKLQMIMNTGDFLKEKEIGVHSQSISMNNASAYWPMFHVVVLIIAGYVQANHIAKFFKKHHIV